MNIVLIVCLFIAYMASGVYIFVIYERMGNKVVWLRSPDPWIFTISWLLWPLVLIKTIYNRIRK